MVVIISVLTAPASGLVTIPLTIRHGICMYVCMYVCRKVSNTNYTRSSEKMCGDSCESTSRFGALFFFCVFFLGRYFWCPARLPSSSLFVQIHTLRFHESILILGIQIILSISTT
jgi:hypothetical protein